MSHFTNAAVVNAQRGSINTLEAKIDALTARITPDISIAQHMEILRQVSLLQHRVNVAEIKMRGIRVPEPEYQIYL